jgi:hypothetical protein
MNTMPEGIPPSVESIPEEMKGFNNWVCWKYEQREGGKPTKIPYNPLNGTKARSNDSSTWTSLVNALAALDSHGYSGVGFMFPGSPYVGIDIDHALNESDALTDEAAGIINVLDSYTEISPSGTGLHIIIRGSLPDGRRRYGNVEMYGGDESKRYFTVTGRCLPSKINIREDQAAINSVHAQYIAALASTEGGIATVPPVEAEKQTLDDQAIIDIAKGASNGDDFERLYTRGDTSGNGGDDSAADMALCNRLAFYTCKNAAQMDRLFRNSRLMRSKWDEQHGAKSYGQITIDKAIADCSEVYSGKQSVEWVEEWETPIPFDTVDLPEFPLKALAGSWNNLGIFIDTVAESTQTPLIMAAILTLGALGVAAQRLYEVEAKPGYIETLSIYAVAIAKPGERKSAVYREVVSPLMAYEKSYNASHAVEIEQSRARKRYLEKRVKYIEELLVKTAGGKQSKGKESITHDDLEDAVRGLVEFEEANGIRLITEDATPEAHIGIMDAQGGCIGIGSAEGMAFEHMINGRYESSDLDLYLKGHAGDSYIYDRKTGAELITIDRAKISLVMTVQPDVINELMKNRIAQGRGLCARIFYAICNGNVGGRDVNSPPIPESIKTGYAQLFDRLLNSSDPGIFQLDSAAKTAYLDFARQIEGRLIGDLEHMQAWGNKATGGMLRIAGILHAVKSINPTKKPIDAETIQAATTITECFIKHAKAAYQIMGTGGDEEDAKQVLGWIKRIGKPEITRTELQKKCSKAYRQTEKIEAALKRLEEMGYIEIYNPASTGGRGKPPKRIRVNPYA